MAAYNATSPIDVEVEHLGHGLIVIPCLKYPLPKRLPPILGDTVHNLRAALDLLASELVRMNGGSDKGVYFPFANSKDELEAAIRQKHIDRAAPEVVDLVRKLAPYKGGNANLRGIHDLDVQDKHSSANTM